MIIPIPFIMFHMKPNQWDKPLERYIINHKSKRTLFTSYYGTIDPLPGELIECVYHIGKAQVDKFYIVLAVYQFQIIVEDVE